jgi:DNA replication protein DnaC
MAIARSEPFAAQACPLGVCDGSGWILGPEDVARPCECREQRLKRGRVRGIASVIPPRYRGVSFDRPPVSDMERDFQSRGAVEEIRRYIDRMEENLAAGNGVWLFGGAGTGKTTLAMLVSKAALEAGHSVAIYSLPKLLARIRRTFESEPGGDSYLSFFERLTSVDLLHIDDLGAEKRSDWVLEQLYALVNERYESKRSILVTTNLDEPELKEQIGHRTMSRLVEMCGAHMIPLHGEDRREPAPAPSPDREPRAGSAKRA